MSPMSETNTSLVPALNVTTASAFDERRILSRVSVFAAE
jgi:hypothetical protein